jgi:hypothetical protein
MREYVELFCDVPAEFFDLCLDLIVVMVLTTFHPTIIFLAVRNFSRLPSLCSLARRGCSL